MSYAYPSYVAESYSVAARRYSNAWQQSDEGEIPHATLEKEVVGNLIGQCRGYKVLDVAGGSGNHARTAIDAGAAHVDVIDISAGFMEIGKEIENQLGREDVIGWHCANAYKPLADQCPELPKGEYDLVVAIWALDHVANTRDLEMLWQNIATYLKPGGRLVGVRVANPKAESARDGQYGVTYHSHEDIEGGVSYRFTMETDPPFTVEASSMETSWTGSTELPNKVGITEFQSYDLTKSETVQADPKYWELLLKDPFWVGFTAVKK